MAIDLQNGLMGQSDVRETITNTAETSVAYNFDYATYDGHLTLTGEYGCFISPDGLNLYINDTNTDDVYQYTMSSRWDITTATLTNTLPVAAVKGYLGIFLSPDGTKMYEVDGSSTNVDQYTLTTAWDLSTAIYLQTIDLSAEVTNPVGIYIREDGRQMFVSCRTSNKIYSYFLSTVWDITTATYIDDVAFAGGYGIFFSRDGQYLFIADGSGTINRYVLSTVFKISTAAADTTLEVFPTLNTRFIFFTQSGNRMFLQGSTEIQQYKVKRGWR